MQNSRNTPSKKVCILSLTEVFDEPRVFRQAHTFEKEGWRVKLVAFRGRSKPPDTYSFLELEKPSVAVTARRSKLLFLSRFFPSIAEGHFWKHPCNQYIWERLKDVQCDLVIAHDYFTAPIAARLAEKCGAQFAIDCHEYARGQYRYLSLRDNLIWKIFDRPYIDALQRKYLKRADAVTTVCDGIADLLQKDYSLKIRPTVVRSVPLYQEMPFRPCGEIINVLYHGLVVPTRGMESAIISVKDWRSEFHLTIRGVGNRDYFEELKQLARKHDVGDRVHFPPPVPFSEMIPKAAGADIGYMVLDNYSPQRTFTLPNKFFEYIMSGLALCVSDLPEMSKIVKKFDLGVLAASTDPRDIAEIINSLDRDCINAYKFRSVDVAKQLNWEEESSEFTNLLADIGFCVSQEQDSVQ